MSRFIDDDDGVVEVFLDVMEKRFASIAQLNIKLVFDTKKRIKKGKICLASVELTNDKLKYFSKDDIAIEGYDAIVLHEPTSGIWGKRIAELAKNGRHKTSAESELALFVEDRKEDVEKNIKPALTLNKIVIMDRFFLFSVAFHPVPYRVMMTFPLT